MKTQDLYYEDLLIHYSIKPTRLRMLVLKTLLNHPAPEFNFTEIVDIISKEYPELTQGGVNTTFRTFKFAGLITKLQDMKDVAVTKGRPRSRFKITEDTLQKLKSLSEERPESFQ